MLKDTPALPKERSRTVEEGKIDKTVLVMGKTRRVQVLNLCNRMPLLDAQTTIKETQSTRKAAERRNVPK